MTNAITEKIINHAIYNNYIKQDQHEEYSYALNMICNILITDITAIIIGSAMKMLWQCITFCLLYKIMCKYCGGFHFSTYLKCYASSCVMFIAALILIRYVPYNIWICNISIIAMSFILFYLSPVQAVNKSLDEKEALIFGKIAKAIIIVIDVAYIISIYVHGYILSKIIIIAIMCVAVFAVIGKMQLIVLNKNRKSLS